MKKLLNVSTHGRDLETIGDDWKRAADFAADNAFDGFELYPVDGYDFARIPADIVAGVHLRFIPVIEAIWHDDRVRLLQTFGDEDAIQLFYGGLDRSAVIDGYRRQLALAAQFGAEYVVFHVSQCELEHVFDWSCPWSWQQTTDLIADVVNAFTADTPYAGLILFENLWWPGSMRLDTPAEITYLLERVTYPRCGIVLDTGHLLNKNQALRTEAEGIDYILDAVAGLGDLRQTIHGVHLTCSLSGKYVIQSRQIEQPFAGCESFWDRFSLAIDHIGKIDRHDPFTDPRIARLFDLIDPEFLVFEFSYQDMAEWKAKVTRQKQALAARFWPVNSDKS
ncbi:MAG: TIM barrel protein [Chloroflexi bacterium]|nr:TIM barrel protein [Chloroflexota bacterium]